MEEQPQTVTLSVGLVNNIVNYLAAKPFSEVVGLINSIQNEAMQNAAAKKTQEELPLTPPAI